MESNNKFITKHGRKKKVSNSIYTSAYRPYLPQINHRKITEQTQEEFSESTRGKQKAIQEYRNLPKQTPQQYQYQSQYQPQYQPQYQNPKQPYQYNYNNLNQNQQNQGRQTPAVKNIVKSMNIQQILIDFKSTINAIGASEDVEEEINGYLDLIDKQTQKENPNKKVIISNLKVCANLLDNYISETLNKPSKVVKDWVEALLMQPIDYRADKTLTKGAFETITGEPPQTAKLAQKKIAQKEANSVKNQSVEAVQSQADEINIAEENNSIEENNISTQEVSITENAKNVSKTDVEINNIILEADNIINKNPDSAMSLYSEAFKLAQKEDNKNLMAKIYSRIGILQNNTNNLIGALDCLNASTLLAYECGETELMAENHAQMGKIYDEKGLFEPAFNHYHRSVALNGELENLDKQTETLTQVGDMFSERYFANEALGYYDLALDMAKENKNYENASNIFRHCAKTNENSGQLEQAMKNLKNAAAISNNINDDSEVASIYEQAGDMMKKMGHIKKAADLYKKAYRLAQKLDNEEMQNNIIAKMQ